MAIDIRSEELVNVNSESRKLPRHPKRGTILNWINQGIRGRSGRRVFLEVVKIGGELCTSQEAFRRFCDALTQDDLSPQEIQEILDHENESPAPCPKT